MSQDLADGQHRKPDPAGRPQFFTTAYYRQAKPPVERLRATVDREHVENQVLACALCFLQQRADDPGADAVALMAGVDLDAGQVDLPKAVVDIQHACRHRPARR